MPSEIKIVLSVNEHCFQSGSCSNADYAVDGGVSPKYCRFATLYNIANKSLSLVAFPRNITFTEKKMMMAIIEVVQTQTYVWVISFLLVIRFSVGFVAISRMIKDNLQETGTDNMLPLSNSINGGSRQRHSWSSRPIRRNGWRMS